MPALSGSPTTPWTAAQLTAAQATHSQFGFAVVEGKTGTTVPAWNVSYDLDETRMPHGTATFTTTPQAAAAIPDALNPRLNWPVHILAGYGTQEVVFSGVVTERRRLNGTVQITLATCDTLLEAPLRRAFTVPVTETNIANLFYYLAVYAPSSLGINYVWDQGVSTWSAADLPAPTAPQLAALRAISMDANDSFGDALRCAADALGQWVHADHRGWTGRGGLHGTDQTAHFLAIRPTYTYADASAPTLTAWSSYEKAETLDGYATSVELTATWTEAAADKSSSLVYSGVAIPNNRTRFVRRNVASQMRPPLIAGSRNLTSANPTGLTYAANYARRTWQTTITSKAWWWLEPKASLKITDPDGGTDAGQVTRLAVNVDAALMTLTLRPPTT